MKRLLIIFIALLVISSMFFFTKWPFRRPVVTSEVNEEQKACPLPIEGTIPVWLSGNMIRNGPVNVTVDGEPNAHWFDGPTMLHAFTMAEGKILYSNKFLKTDAYHSVFCIIAKHFVKRPASLYR